MGKSGKKKIIKILIPCVLAASVGLLFTGGMGAPRGGGMPGGETEEPVKKTVVETQAPVLGSISVSGSFVGTVEPGQKVTVYPKAQGEVVEVNYNVGDTVEAGDVLFKLDATSVELELAQTRATLKNAQAVAVLTFESAQRDFENFTNNVGDGLNASLINGENTVRAMENALQQANIAYRTARDDFSEYVRDMWDGDSDDATYQALRSARALAELRVESAQNSLEGAKVGLEATRKQMEEQAVTAETGVKRAEIGTDFTANNISLQKLQNTLDNYTVKSPISGVVEHKNIEVYNTVSTQIQAYVISNKDLVTVSFGVPESALTYLKPGDTLTIEKNGATCTGKVTEVSTMVSGGLYTVKATVENAPFDLYSGSTVKLYAVTQKVENEIVIPIDAVYYEVGNPHVFVFEDNTARKVQVEVGISDDKYIHIKSGLSMSDEVIVTWSSSLYDGAEVYLPGTAPQDNVDTTGGDEVSSPGI